jgi:hypothetical protein
MSNDKLYNSYRHERGQNCGNLRIVYNSVFWYGFSQFSSMLWYIYNNTTVSSRKLLIFDNNNETTKILRQEATTNLIRN